MRHHLLPDAWLPLLVGEMLVNVNNLIRVDEAIESLRQEFGFREPPRAS
jgi:hypothetical protein